MIGLLGPRSTLLAAGLLQAAVVAGVLTRRHLEKLRNRAGILHVDTGQDDRHYAGGRRVQRS